MPFLKKQRKSFAFGRYILLLFGFLFGAMYLVWPNTMDTKSQHYEQIDSVMVRPIAHGWVIDVRASLMLQQELALAAQKGVPLAFTYEIEIRKADGSQKDWQLFQQRTWEVEYNALLRQWLLHGDAGVTDIELSLADSLSQLGYVKNWYLMGLPEGVDYQARIRLYLDISLLPRAFQFDALNNPAWVLSTTWKEFKLRNLAN